MDTQSCQEVYILVCLVFHDVSSVYKDKRSLPQYIWIRPDVCVNVVYSSTQQTLEPVRRVSILRSILRTDKHIDGNVLEGGLHYE